MDPISFLFVQETGTGPQGIATQSRIRAHVMDRVMTQKWLSKQENSKDNDERRPHKKLRSPKSRDRRSWSRDK
jgi:hypothetical protein